MICIWQAMTDESVYALAGNMFLHDTCIFTGKDLCISCPFVVKKNTPKVNTNSVPLSCLLQAAPGSV